MLKLVLYFYSNFQDARSRALDNLGRVYARVGNFKKAISWYEKFAKMNTMVVLQGKTWKKADLG